MDTMNEPTKKFEAKISFHNGDIGGKIVESSTEEDALNKLADELGSTMYYVAEIELTELIELSDDTIL